MTETEPPHKWFWCDTCSIWTLLCGRCGNNVCGAGTGEEIGPEPGTTIACRRCEDAYQRWIAYEGIIDDPNTQPEANNSDQQQSVDTDASQASSTIPS